MKYSLRLMRATVHGHLGFDKILTDPGESDSKNFHQRVLAPLIEFFERHLSQLVRRRFVSLIGLLNLSLA